MAKTVKILRIVLPFLLFLSTGLSGGCAKKADKPVVVPRHTALAGSYRAADVADNYPEPWRTDFRPRLHQILMENDVKNCKEPQHRLHSSGRSYLVKCDSDLYYIAWLGQGLLGGPYQKRKGSFLKGDERPGKKAERKTVQKVFAKGNPSVSGDEWERAAGSFSPRTGMGGK